MPNVNISTVAKEKDKFGVKIGDWAEQAGPGQFKCKICLPAKILSFGKGKKDLTQHSETARHRKQFLSSNNNASQPSIVDLVHSQKHDETKQKARDLENAICMMLSRHGYQHTMVDCLIEILQKFITDSEIVKKVKLGRTKAGYVISHGLGEYYEKETVSLIKTSNSFAASIDES